MGNRTMSALRCSESYPEKLNDNDMSLRPKEISRRSVLQQPIHKDSVTCLSAVRPGLVISGSADKTVVLSNFETGEKLKEWVGHDREVTKLCYNAAIQNQIVLSGSRDASIRLWHLHANSSGSIYLGHALTISGLAIVESSGTKLCSGSRDNSVKLWDLERSQCIKTVTIAQNLVTHMEWSKTGNFLAQTSEDKELRLWDPRTMEVSYSFPKTDYIQSHCDISSNGFLILTTTNGFNSNGCEVIAWDVRQQKMLKKMCGHEQSVNSAAFVEIKNLQKNLAVSVSVDHTVKLWNLDLGGCIWTETVPMSGALFDAVSYNDGRYTVILMKNYLRIHT